MTTRSLIDLSKNVVLHEDRKYKSATQRQMKIATKPGSQNSYPNSG